MVYDRSILVIAHSHGGNIAVRARANIAEPDRKNIHCILMATPFVESNQRYDIRELYRALPTFLARNYYLISMVGFWFATVVGMSRLADFLLGEEANFIRSAFVHGRSTLGELPLVISAFFGPFLLFHFLWSRAEKLLTDMPQSTPEALAMPCDSSPHFVITYTQDEAYQVLSLIVNMLSLVYQGLFAFMRALADFSARVKVLDLAWSACWLVFGVFYLSSLVGVNLWILLDAVTGVWITHGPWFEYISSILTFAWDMFFRIVTIIINQMFVVVVYAGLACFSGTALLLAVGVTRLAVLSVVGLMDQFWSRDSIVNALVETISISTSPVGRATTLVLKGRSLFNHTKIYDEDATIKFVAEQVTLSLQGVQGPS